MAIDPMSEMLAELARLRVREEDVGTVLDRLMNFALRTLPGCERCSLTVRDPRGPRTVAASDDVVRDVDEFEFSIFEGPCADAFDTGQLVRADDLAGESRWPRFSAYAVSRGQLACLAAPLRLDTRVLGAVNVYSSQVDGLCQVSDDTLAEFGRLAAVAVENVAAYRDAVTLAGQLREAMTSRAVIEQAKGVLMARHGCSADDAFTQLAAMSQHENVKLRDIAAAVIAGRATRA